MKRLVKKLWGKPQPRPLRSYVARALIPRGVLFLALASALLVGQAMSVDPLASPAETDATPPPAWTGADAVANPGCVPSSQWPEGTIPGSVVVHRSGEQNAFRLGFDHAWRINHDDTEVNDVWVVGICH